MEFIVIGKRERVTTTTTTITEYFDGVLKVTKKNVMELTDCEAVEDGDPTGWYGHVEQALEWDVPYTDTTNSDIVEIESEETTKTETTWTDLEVSWF